MKKILSLCFKVAGVIVVIQTVVFVVDCIRTGISKTKQIIDFEKKIETSLREEEIAILYFDKGNTCGISYVRKSGKIIKKWFDNKVGIPPWANEGREATA